MIVCWTGTCTVYGTQRVFTHWTGRHTV